MAEKELTRDLTKEEVAEFKEAFDMFDMDGGGSWLLRTGDLYTDMVVGARF